MNYEQAAANDENDKKEHAAGEERNTTHTNIMKATRRSISIMG